MERTGTAELRLAATGEAERMASLSPRRIASTWPGWTRSPTPCRQPLRACRAGGPDGRDLAMALGVVAGGAPGAL